MDFYRQAASIFLGKGKPGVLSINHAETAVNIDERSGLQGAFRRFQLPSKIRERFLRKARAVVLHADYQSVAFLKDI